MGTYCDYSWERPLPIVNTHGNDLYLLLILMELPLPIVDTHWNDLYLLSIVMGMTFTHIDRY